ncbi:MAG: divalent-cation tolerance protein CutA [Planctomycetaceae bacterium]|jgi:periplasmic divalent cation tolerance protein|nr:divalent-cation tolerance protein CutA [Planctomycetaceae bacterium]
MSTYIQVQITFPTEESAYQAATKLVETHLAACAQVLKPIRSIYVWKGNCETSDEVLVLAKTKSILFDRLVELVRDGHPYECPQIVALPILAGNEDYLAWLEEQCNKCKKILWF